MSQIQVNVLQCPITRYITQKKHNTLTEIYQLVSNSGYVIDYYFVSEKLIETEFTQYLIPVDVGPSLKTCPK